MERMQVDRDHLIQSALGVKAEAELWDNPEGCSQDGTAMFRHEEASFRCQTGLLMSRVGGRTSLSQVKSVSPLVGSPAAMQAVSGSQSDTVRHAIMPGEWCSNITDEVLRRPDPPGRVTVGYKSITKDQPQAPVTETKSHWLRLQGCQQRQSRPPQAAERQYRREPDPDRADREPVSLARFSHQMVGLLFFRANEPDAKKQFHNTARFWNGQSERGADPDTVQPRAKVSAAIAPSLEVRFSYPMKPVSALQLFLPGRLRSTKEAPSGWRGKASLGMTPSRGSSRESFQGRIATRADSSGWLCLGPNSGSLKRAMSVGSPGARNTHAGKYGE